MSQKWSFGSAIRYEWDSPWICVSTTKTYFDRPNLMATVLKKAWPFLNGRTNQNCLAFLNNRHTELSVSLRPERHYQRMIESIKSFPSWTWSIFLVERLKPKKQGSQIRGPHWKSEKNYPSISNQIFEKKVKYLNIKKTAIFPDVRG